MRINKICIKCGKEYQVWPYKSETSKHCSKACKNSPIIKTCLICKTGYRVPLSRVQKSNYCSPDCSYLGKNRKISKICEICGISFSVSPSQERVKRCSRECYYKSQMIYLEQECLFCNKIFRPEYPDVIFCSQSCMGSYRSQKVKKICERCGNGFFVKLCQKDIFKYCSRDCKRTSFIKNCKICEKPILVKLANSDKYKCCSKACGKKWRLRHVANSLHMSAIRRRLHLNQNAKGSFTNKQWLDKLDFHGFRCYLCGQSLRNQTPHKEHRIPLTRGGTNWIANIAPACPKCNFQKNNKTEREYRKWLGKIVYSN